MQRKVFEIDGQSHLATRDGSFFETAGTLERLIAGELEAQQRADLAAWEAGGTAEPSPAPVPAQAAPEPAKPCLFWLSPPCEFVLLSSYFYYS
jgi:hypothetical protein